MNCAESRASRARNNKGQTKTTAAKKPENQKQLSKAVFRGRAGIERATPSVKHESEEEHAIGRHIKTVERLEKKLSCSPANNATTPL